MKRRKSQNFEEQLKSCDIRALGDRCPSLKGEGLDSVEPTKIIFVT